MEDLLELDDKPANYETEAFNGGWYEYNCEKFGTKWDFGCDDTEFQIGDRYIYFDILTAWAPPCNFLSNLCIKYGVTAKILYFEPGMDFSGNAEYNENGKEISLEESSYLKGIHDFTDEFDYYLDDYLRMWADNEEEWNDVKKYIDFLSEDELQDIKEEYEEILNEIKK
jgi:hypothetical protein